MNEEVVERTTVKQRAVKGLKLGAIRNIIPPFKMLFRQATFSPSATLFVTILSALDLRKPFQERTYEVRDPFGLFRYEEVRTLS